MLYNVKESVPLPKRKGAGNTAFPWFSGFLCLTPVFSFAAVEHRGLCEDEILSQHLEGCLMIIKNKMDYSLKWQTEVYIVV